MLLAAVAVSACRFCFHFVQEKTCFLCLKLEQTDFIERFRESTFFFFSFFLVFFSFLLLFFFFFVILTHPPPSQYLAPTPPERARGGARFIETLTTQLKSNTFDALIFGVVLSASDVTANAADYTTPTNF